MSDNKRVADALEACNWSGDSIGNKAIIAQAIACLRAEKPQSESVGEVVAFGEGLHEIAWAAGRMPKLGAKLYTHADPAEVEQLRDENRRLHEAGEFLDGVNQGIEDKLRAQLAEAHTLLRMVYLDEGTTDEKCARVEQIISASEGLSAKTKARNECEDCGDDGQTCTACAE